MENIVGICKHCSLSVRDKTKICPLCSHSLDIEGTEKKAYPKILDKLKRKNLTLRIFLASAFAFCLFMLYIDFYYSDSLDWSIVGIGILFFAYFTLHDFVYLKRRLFTIISRLLFRLFLLVFLVDFVLGFNRWSLDYALPGFVILENIVLVCFVFFDKKNRKSYMYYDIWVVLCNIGLIILYALSIIRIQLVLVLSIQISLIVFFSLLIIGGLSARKEITRRWHVRKK